MRSPLRAILDLFSSVRLGVVLLVLLFIYMSVGSAGVVYPVRTPVPVAGMLSQEELDRRPAFEWRHEQIRQRPGLEMTEFEWFHWWPFDLLIGLIAANIVVTTLRRIPLKPINFGVWLIHTGVLVLIVGSVIYFSTKIEGEAPVVRRAVVIDVLDESGETLASGRVLAMPGSTTSIGTERDGFVFEVMSTDPAWELLTGDDAGQRAFSVNLLVTRPDRSRFVRQLIDGRPEYTEDLIFTEDRTQPLQRAVKATGEAIVEPRIRASLEYESTGWVYLRNDITKSWALYVRRPGDTEWTMRPIDGLPLYNEWIASFDDVQVPDGMNLPRRLLDVAVPPAAEGDPFPDVTFTVDGYLRYAFEQTRVVDGGASSPINPTVSFTVRGPGGTESSYTLVAFDAAARSAEQGVLRMRTIADESEFAKLLKPPTLRFRVPSLEIDVEAPIRGAAIADPDLEFEPIGSGPEGAASGYAYRVIALEDDVAIGGTPVSLVILEVKTPQGSYRRWVFDRPEMTRDAPTDGMDPHTAPTVADASIETTYAPGAGRAIILLVAGPEAERLRAVVSIGEREPNVVELAGTPGAPGVGKPIELGAGLTMVMTRYLPRAKAESRLAIVPPSQRIRDAGEQFSRIRLTAPGGATTWLPYHRFVFDRAEEKLRRTEYRPTRVRLSDGRDAEVMFSRRRMALPAEIALDTFVLTSHVGGFTGETASIRDYTSVLRFRDPGGEWGPPTEVSVNEPVEHGGLWYFQAQWDPPDEARRQGERASQGLNYTVLGVGNRHGVWTQLAGVIIATLGMIYAFYVKPAIKRRRAAAVREALAAGTFARAIGGAGVAGVLAALTMTGAVLMPTASATAQSAAPSTSAPTASAPAAGEPEKTFAERVDLRPLGSVAVHAEGRLKSYGSFANTMMNLVSGPRKIAGQDPSFTYLDMLFRPQAYADADVIYVKNREVRARIADAWRAAAGEAKITGRAPAGIDLDDLDARLAAFEKSGLISPRFLLEPGVRQWRREITPLMRVLEGDLIRSEKQVTALQTALGVSDPEVLLSSLRMLPPGGGSTDARWHSISEIQSLPGGPDGFDAAFAARLNVELDEPIAGLDAKLQEEIAGQWRALARAWGRGDADAVNAAVVRLAELLPQTDPEIYPETSRLWWESWYFRNGNMTRVWLVYMGAVFFLLLGLVYRWPTARRIGLGVFFIAFLLQTASVALRWWISGRWPNSNMFEAVTTSAWMGACAALILEGLARRTPMRGMFALGASVASMVALMAAALLPAQLNPNISNMMPVLHDVWLYIHTNVIIFSYVLIFMAAVSALVYLGHRALGGAATFARVGGAGEMMALAEGDADHSADGIEHLVHRRGARLGEVLDGVTMLLVEVSFVMLWTGTSMGAIWADHSWGRPWGWDPKEVFALSTFVVFAILIHVRLFAKDKGLWTALLALVGAGVMLFNWIVINFVITGLHSYA